MARLNKLKLATVLLTASAYLYKSITQRSPLYLLDRPPPLPASISSSCSKNFSELLHNCEDFSILPNTTLLFLSCDRSRREWYHAFRAFPWGVAKGEIFLWDYSKPEVEPTLLSGAESLGVDFHPLGISAVPREGSGGGEVRLFVTNQAKKEPRIEVLDVNLDTKTARHKRSLTDAKISSPNGIVGIDENSFFITNDGFFSRVWSTLLLFEVILGAPGGQVVHVSVPPVAPAAATGGKDSVNAYSVAWISLANGLALDRVKQKLYIASSTHGVYTYSIPDMEHPYLAVPESFRRTPFAADNIHLGPTGRLFVSGIYSLSDFASSMLSQGPVPPAWTAELLAGVDPSDRREVALRGLDPANSPLRKEEWMWRSVYLDDGRFFGGVSTGGVVDMQGTFVGVSVVGEGVLVCKKVIGRPGVLVKKEEEEKKVKEEL